MKFPKVKFPDHKKAKQWKELIVENISFVNFFKNGTEPRPIFLVVLIGPGQLPTLLNVRGQKKENKQKISRK